MKLSVGFFVITSWMLLAACAAQPPMDSTQPAAEAATEEVFLPTVSEPDEPVHAKIEPAGDSCPSESLNVIAQSIDEEFDPVDYDQIMTWFCAGAAFEDIVVALQTEEMTEVPAEELLEMIAEGFSWEEIWDAVGLN